MIPPAFIYQMTDLSSCQIIPMGIAHDRQVRLLVSKQGDLLQLRVNSQGNSAFLNDIVVQDSRILYTVPSSPVLLFAQKLSVQLAKQKVPFVELDSLLGLQSQPLQSLISVKNVISELSKVCNVKNLGGQQFYQPSTEKMLEYLCKLYEKSKKYVIEKAGILFEGESITQEKVDSVSLQTLFEYLPDTIGQQLIAKLGLKRAFKFYKDFGLTVQLKQNDNPQYQSKKEKYVKKQVQRSKSEKVISVDKNQKKINNFFHKA